MSETEIVYMVEYDEDADLKVEMVDGEPVVQNHDELEKHGVVRCLDSETAYEYNMDILDEDDHLWDVEFEEMERGDETRV